MLGGTFLKLNNMQIVTVDGTFIEKLYRRVKSVLQGYDSHDSLQVAPWGDDSAPIKSVKCVKSPTSTASEQVILGYFNKNQKAQAGEKRIFATDEDGNVIGELYLTKTGKMQLHGAGNWLVKFTEMKAAYDALASAYLLHQHPETGATTGVPIAQPTFSMDTAKTTRIETS